MIDVAAGEDISRKGGAAITRSDVLIVNKMDLAPHVGASLGIMARDAARMRGARPVVFTDLKRGGGVAATLEALDEIAGLTVPG